VLSRPRWPDWLGGRVLCSDRRVEGVPLAEKYGVESSERKRSGEGEIMNWGLQEGGQSNWSSWLSGRRKEAGEAGSVGASSGRQSDSAGL
jgi:hypothetical protein